MTFCLQCERFNVPLAREEGPYVENRYDDDGKLTTSPVRDDRTPTGQTNGICGPCVERLRL